MLETLIILIALVAFLLDSLTSSLLMPKIRVHGQRSALTPQEEHSNPDWLAGSSERRIYQFAVQSDEARPVDFPGAGLRVCLNVRGRGGFAGESPIVVFGGLSDVRAYWVAKPSRAEVRMDNLRPHKTIVLRCYMTGDVEEMEMEVYMPSRWPARRMLMELGRNLFSFEPPADQKRIVVRENEDKSLARGFRHETFLAVRLALFSILATLLYSYLYHRVAPAVLSPVPQLHLLEVLGVGVVVFVAAYWLNRLARRPSLPIAQGFQIGRPVSLADRSGQPPAGGMGDVSPM